MQVLVHTDIVRAQTHLQSSPESIVAFARHLGEVGNSLTSANGRDIGKLPKQRIESLRLSHRGDLIGELPEEHRHADRAPELRDDVKQGVAPVADKQHGVLQGQSFVTTADATNIIGGVGETILAQMCSIEYSPSSGA